ncbi:MAG: GFA family protein [Alphaproteobacteria bacterium]|nr:GFA family protein [Alphaproteobacteria bacterium]
MILAHSAGFAHLGGELARWRKRAASGREIDIVRCARCGVRMWHEPLASPEFVFIAAGTLDRPGWAVPASHIWTASALPGTGFLEDAVRFDAQPPSRQALIEAFEGIYGTSPSTGPATAPRH